MNGFKPPFPWFGGKRRIASLVWERFGDVPNYVEPFAGSLAVLFIRPDDHHWPRIETVNDFDAHLCNFWRALQAAPDEVACYADWPVNEIDLHARGDWLFYRPSAREWVEQLRADPDWYDAKSAGWWVWFVSNWIGGLPSVGKPQVVGGGTKRQLPHLADAGMGVSRQLPHLADAGKGVSRKDDLTAYMRALAARLERVRVCCGDWSRVLGPSVTERFGTTAIFLDPPYSHAVRDGALYSIEHDIAHEVREWAIANGDNPKLRIALCGYDNEHGDAMPDTWREVAWKAGGGYGNKSNGRGNGDQNGKRERIWFSPHCLIPDGEQEATLFSYNANGR